MADGALATGASELRERGLDGEGEAGERRVCVCGVGGFRLKPDD